MHAESADAQVQPALFRDGILAVAQHAAKALFVQGREPRLVRRQFVVRGQSRDDFLGKPDVARAAAVDLGRVRRHPVHLGHLPLGLPPVQFHAVAHQRRLAGAVEFIQAAPAHGRRRDRQARTESQGPVECRPIAQVRAFFLRPHRRRHVGEQIAQGGRIDPGRLRARRRRVVRLAHHVAAHGGQIRATAQRQDRHRKTNPATGECKRTRQIATEPHMKVFLVVVAAPCKAGASAFNSKHYTLTQFTNSVTDAEPQRPALRGALIGRPAASRTGRENVRNPYVRLGSGRPRSSLPTSAAARRRGALPRTACFRRIAPGRACRWHPFCLNIRTRRVKRAGQQRGDSSCHCNPQPR